MTIFPKTEIDRRTLLRGLGMGAGVVAFGVGLAGCAPTSVAPAKSATAAPKLPKDQSKTLVFWHTYTQQARVDFMKGVASEFEAAHPGVNVQIEVVPLPQYSTKWPAAQAAGSLPDVTTLLPETAVSMWLADALYPTDAVLSKLGGSSAFVNGLAEKMGHYQGHQISLPHYVHNRLLIHRKDLLAEAGVTLSESPSWDEALHAAQKTTVAPGRYGWQLKLSESDTGGGYLLYMMTHSAGGKLLDAKGNSMLTSSEVQKAAKYIVELGKTASGPGQSNYNINDDFKLITAGNTVMAEDSSAVIGTAVTTAPDVAKNLVTSFMPKDKQPGHLLGALSVALPKGKNPNLAQEFAEFLYAKENYVPFLHSIPLFMYPTLTSASGSSFFENPIIKQYKAVADQTLAGIKVGFGPAFDDGPNPYAGPMFASHEIERALQSVLVGGVSVKSALANANQNVQSLFSDIRSRVG